MRPAARLASFGALLTCLAGAAHAGEQEWRFDVYLEDKPIGRQSFRLTDDGKQQRMLIEASFDVKILFFTAYSYRHRNEELWEDGCLKRIRSTTDDNGESFRVDGEDNGAGFVVTTKSGRTELGGCVRSFAYWNPELLDAERLLNSQTGEYEAANLTLEADKVLTTAGKALPATRYLLRGDKFRIELWYSPGGDWIALESASKGGRKLRYVRSD